VAIAALIVALEDRDDRSGDSSGGFTSALPVSEFFYLDGAKILTYLSELEGGERGSAHEIVKTLHELKGEIGVEGVTGSAISQHETLAESSIVRTEASELGLLLRDLNENKMHGVSYHNVDITKPGSLTDLKEGELVRFVTRSLSAPGYIRPYVVVRDSATLGALFPRKLGSEASADHASQQRRLAKVFINQIGPDPRITFLITPPEETHNVPTIILPISYSGLTTERSLLEKDRAQHTGGRLVVFGKVDRVFGTEECPEEEPTCNVYTDFATREVWKNPIEQGSSYLINHVSHTCERQLVGDFGGIDADGPDKITGRECFISELDQQTELSAPGAVIVPIAIVK
jgi:hypothetical protein